MLILEPCKEFENNSIANIHVKIRKLLHVQRKPLEQIMRKKCYFLFNFARKTTPLSTIKGNNSCKAYTFINEIGKLQMVYYC